MEWTGMPKRTIEPSGRRLVLREYETTEPVWLSSEDREELTTMHPGLRVLPVGRNTGSYSLTPDQHVGVLRLPSMTVEIQPKIPMRSALYLISVAAGAVDWHRGSPTYDEDATFTDLVAIMFARLVDIATRKG